MSYISNILLSLRIFSAYILMEWPIYHSHLNVLINILVVTLTDVWHASCGNYKVLQTPTDKLFLVLCREGLCFTNFHSSLHLIKDVANECVELN